MNVLKEIRARAAMIENAEKLLNQAETTAAALEDNPNVDEETKRRAREKVDAFKLEVQKNIDYAKEREFMDRTILKELEESSSEPPRGSDYASDQSESDTPDS